jgi:Predicted membrane protein
LASVSNLKKVPNIDGDRIMRFGHLVSRYGLVVVLAWIGAGKYVKMESRVLIQHSPLMSWLYDFLSFKAVANALGTMEIIAAILIAIRPLWPRISALGSALAIVLFLGTISFLFTTPGVIADFAHGFPVLSAQPGQSPQGLGADGGRTLDLGRFDRGGLGEACEQRLIARLVR